MFELKLSTLISPALWNVQIKFQFFQAFFLSNYHVSSYHDLPPDAGEHGTS